MDPKCKNGTKRMWRASFLFSILALTLTSTTAAPLEDLVENLPDYGRPPSSMFSGYLDASDGCDTETNGDVCKLHYWLAMAEVEDPTNAPVVLWLNGGPGSSSVYGFLQENGPLLINATGGLMRNPWSWTKVANLLVLEAPIGVGYSYCSKQFLGQPCVNTDKFTASASRAALVDFFQNKFPELSHNNFFITGESYAGVYIPTLSKEILDNAPGLNLVGIAVGDPCTDNTAQQDSMDALWYGHKYGLVDDAVFDKLWHVCGYRAPTVTARGGPHVVSKSLNKKLLRVSDISKRRRLAKKLLLETDQVKEHAPEEQSKCTLALRKFLFSSSHALSQGWKDMFIDDYSLFAPVTFKQDEDMAEYMSRSDVRKALHVEEAPTAIWPYVDIGFSYTSEYDACNSGDIKPGTWSMIAFYKDISPRLHATLIYNGDSDPCVSYEGTATAIKRVGFPELDGGGYRPWFYTQDGVDINILAEKAPLFGPNLLAQDVGVQMGGEIVDYENNLSFLTFHGSGHMIPQFRPQAALHMLGRLISLKPLSPLLPSNDTIKGMNDEDFQEALDNWTEYAKSSSFVD